MKDLMALKEVPTLHFILINQYVYSVAEVHKAGWTSQKHYDQRGGMRCLNSLLCYSYWLYLQDIIKYVTNYDGPTTTHVGTKQKAGKAAVADEDEYKSDV